MIVLSPCATWMLNKQIFAKKQLPCDTGLMRSAIKAGSDVVSWASTTL